MGKIKELRQDIIEQIAAGEVVEDPSAVVKELVENSIDANSNKIFIEIQDGGKSLIRITDDGSGMTKDDAVLSVKRHATSKIEGLSDLFNIQTLGFRGEALAAISSVSKFEIITKTDYAVEGVKVKISDGETNAESVACPKGTTIVVKDLFYNTPARKKHLRSNASEASKITDIITKYSLTNPLIYFRLTVDGKQVINSPNTASMINNIVDIYGNDIAKELLEIDFKDENYNIKGYISKPSFSRSDKDLMNIFINNRYVKSKTITDAVYDAYHTLLHSHRYPFAMLQIYIDPKKIDVNIHPNKMKIKIEQEGKLYEKIFDIIRNTLKNNDILSKQANSKESHEQTDNNKQNDIQSKFENEASNQSSEKQLRESKGTYSKYPIQHDRQETIMEKNNYEDNNEETPKNTSDDLEKSSLKPEDEILTNTKTEKEIRKSMSEYAEVVENGTKTIDTSSSKHKLKIIGQIMRTYILIETSSGLTIMDQHAAHERTLFEKILNDSRSMKIEKQELLSPIEMSLSLRETGAIESNKSILREFGFELENFGGGSYILRTVPVIFKKTQTKEFLEDLISDLLNHAKINSLDKMKHEIIGTMACKAAIKAGDELTREQMKDIVTDFFGLELSYTCQHGRPVVIEITLDELEKKFKRKGF